LCALGTVCPRGTQQHQTNYIQMYHGKYPSTATSNFSLLPPVCAPHTAKPQATRLSVLRGFVCEVLCALGTVCPRGTQQHQTNYIQMYQKVKIALHYDSSYSPYCKSIRVLGSTLLSFFLSIRLVTKLSTETSSWLLTSNDFLE